MYWAPCSLNYRDLTKENIVLLTIASKLIKEFEKIWENLIKSGGRNTHQELEIKEEETRKREEVIATVEQTREISENFLVLITLTYMRVTMKE